MVGGVSFLVFVITAVHIHVRVHVCVVCLRVCVHVCVPGNRTIQVIGYALFIGSNLDY